MIFKDIPDGLSVFIDANTLVYHFTAHSTMGAACTELLERIERKEVTGYTSSHVVAEMAHRLMTIEAMGLFGWPAQGIVTKLRNHPAEVQQLGRHRQAIDELSLLYVQVLPVEQRQVSGAADVTRQTGLLFNDGVIVALMRDHGLTALASNDADFDRVPGITRYAPL
jgi:predicted nucleic acid-binding protein